MTVKDWLTHPQDERQRFFWARAGALSFGVTGIVACLIAAVLTVRGELSQSLIVIAPWLVGSLVNTGLLLYWKVLSPS